MEPIISLLCLQKLAKGPYFETEKSIRQRHKIVSILFNIILSQTCRSPT